ncbi:complement C1q tumor necrosis factor-related protein 3-like [Mya arenaria]|uniref:complement C1q tumor necrosis factor-related protein 3-like n=1 Tax=Mya arenaria TaxID=6604 RepID=UPI0022E6DCD0|nr:complement C1q tumor necrosis factor-related protein 3-like [Mya arenaria]
MKTLCVFLLALCFVLSLAENERLDEIERLLKGFVKKNEELQARVSSLEQENMLLKSDGKLKRFIMEPDDAVAFTAVINVPYLDLLGAGQTVIFDHVITNVGNAFKNATSEFRAPVTGVYVFNFALMMDPGMNKYIELVKDGQHIMWNYGHAPGSTHYISASRTATVLLRMGEEVWVRTQNRATHGNGRIHGNGFTTFSGWLVALTEQ